MWTCSPLSSIAIADCFGSQRRGQIDSCNALVGKLDGALLLDADISVSDAFNQPDQQYRPFFEQWLRLCKNINQAGRPVVLWCRLRSPRQSESGGTALFSTIHYLALVCDAEILQENCLRQRPDQGEQ